MIGRLFSNRYGATVLGVLLVAIGIFGFDSNEVKCGSQTMRPGDHCVETRKGSSTTRTYEEQKSQDHLYRYGFIIVGTLMFGIGAALIIKRHAGGGKGGAPAVAAAPAGGQPPFPPQGQPQQQPQYPQQQGYPPQQQGYPPQQPQQQYPQQAQYPPQPRPQFPHQQ
jgi:hypothetical protein